MFRVVPSGRVSKAIGLMPAVIAIVRVSVSDTASIMLIVRAPIDPDTTNFPSGVT